MRPLALLALFAAAAPAFAGGAPAARVAALLRASALPDGEPAPSLDEVPALEAPAAAANATTADSVIPAGLWETLAAPDAPTLTWLAARIPGLRSADVRTLTVDAADAMFAKAVALGQSPLDFFTDPGFRGDAAYYLPQAAVQTLFDRYEVRVLTPASGTTADGRAFHMLGLVIGGGRIDALYDLDQFAFDHPLFPDYRYTLAARVTERIQGPGDLTVEGVSLKAGLVHPVIKRIVKLSATNGRVETNYGAREKPVSPIRRR